MADLQKAKDRINEYNAGHMFEYRKPDGSMGMFNKLDYEVAKKHKAAKVQEEALRIQNHSINVTVIVLVIVIVLMVMLVIYINMTTDITGIYYDSSGNKIELYHNKTAGSLEIKSTKGNKRGVLKKINTNTYGIYLNEDMIVKDLEHIAQPVAAYANLKSGNITWKNDIWKLDRQGYVG